MSDERVLLGLAGKITAQSHRDRTGSDLGYTCDHYNCSRINGATQSRSQGERNGETIAHPDYNIGNKITAFQVLLLMI